MSIPRYYLWFPRSQDVATCGKTWAEFEEFIEAPTSRRLVKSIRTLTLIPQRRPADIAASPRSRPAMLEVDPYVLPALAAKLPRLSKLFLCNVTFGHPRPDDLPLIAPVLPKINELFISSHVDFPVFVLSDLWFLVQSFPNVHALTFRGMSLDSGARRSNILRLPLLPGLKQLDVLDCSDVVCLLDDLRVAIKEQRLPVLGGLSMGCIDKRNTVQPIKDVLDILGGRLSVLALQCDAGLLVRTWLFGLLYTAVSSHLTRRNASSKLRAAGWIVRQSSAPPPQVVLLALRSDRRPSSGRPVLAFRARDTHY